KLDVLIEIDAQFGGTANDVVPVDVGGKAGGLHLLTNAFRLQSFQPSGTHQGAGREKAAEFVAGVQSLVEMRTAGEAVLQIIGVRQNRVDHVFGIAAFAKN